MAMALKQPFNAHADVHWPAQRAALKLVHLLCQPDWIGNHLEDAPLSLSMREFLERFSGGEKIHPECG